MKRLLLAATIALLALPSIAHASTCQRVNQALAVHLGGSTDVANLYRVGDTIYNGSTPCAGATVHNIDTVFISDTTPNKDGTDFVGINMSGGPFAPGTGSSKNGQVPEIKIELYLGLGDNFVLVTGTDGSDTIRGGRTIDYNGDYLQGLNLNAGAEEQAGKVPDPDVVWQRSTKYPNPPGHETFQIDGGSGNDTINLSGGAGFDTAFNADTTIYGGSGDDTLTGGDRTDTFFAEPGDDVLDGGRYYDGVSFQTSQTGVTVDLANPNPQDNGALGKDRYRNMEGVTGSEHDDVLGARDGGTGLRGMGGNDLLVGSPYNDEIDGGAGMDTVSYQRSTTGVTVDLGIRDKSQITDAGHYDSLTDVENLVGSPHADELAGDAAPNTIDGGGGADSIVGKGARDELLLRDGAPDQVTCGTGTDHVVADRQGTDAIFSDCEMVDFAPAPVGQPTPTPTPGSDPGKPTPSPSSDRVAPVLSGLKLKGKKISYKLSEPATVRFTVQRRTGGKWKRLRGALSQKGAAGLNKLRFKRAAGRYRLTAVATDAAGNKSRAKVIRFRVAR